MGDVYKLCDFMKMLALQCETCGSEKITLMSGEVAKIAMDAVEMLEMQQKEIATSNKKIMYLLDVLIKGRE